MSELLNENTVVSYLTARGVISGPAEVEILTGGVSNVVLAIKTNNKDLVCDMLNQTWLLYDIPSNGFYTKANKIGRAHV